jgi:hypothetical protein
MAFVLVWCRALNAFWSNRKTSDASGVPCGASACPTGL